MRLNNRFVTAVLCGFLALGMISCGEEGDEGWSDDPKDALTPDEQKTLVELKEAELKKTLAATVIEIQAARPEGITKLITQLKADLKAINIDAKELDNITDAKLCSKGSDGEVSCIPMAGMSSGSTTPKGVGTLEQKLSGGSQYYACPLKAPDQQGTTCEQLAAATATKVAAAIAQGKGQMEAHIAKTYKDMSATAQQFIAAWKFTATQYGATLATLYATHELKAAARCDTKANVYDVSYNLGVTQGVKIVLSLRAWALSQVTSCTVNTDLIAKQVKTTAISKIKAYMNEHGVCKDEDISGLDHTLQLAEIKRESGIKKGIDTQVQVLRNELFQRRQTAPCGGGGGGEPLVIDLDGDGLTLSSTRVSFDLLGDGTQQRTTWVGAREGLLALDRDGDGAITSVHELLGDKGNCAGQACYDGIEALKAMDSNGDARLDANDPVYAQLLVWTDADQDGVSAPGELRSLSDHGIRALKLQASDLAVRHAGGTVLRSLQVVTDQGARTAYDVWFRVRLNMDNLGVLAPR